MSKQPNSIPLNSVVIRTVFSEVQGCSTRRRAAMGRPARAYHGLSLEEVCNAALSRWLRCVATIIKTHKNGVMMSIDMPTWMYAIQMNVSMFQFCFINSGAVLSCTQALISSVDLLNFPFTQCRIAISNGQLAKSASHLLAEEASRLSFV